MPSKQFEGGNNSDKLNYAALQLLRREGGFERNASSAPSSRSASLKYAKRTNIPDNQTIRRYSVPDAFDAHCNRSTKTSEQNVESGVRRVRSFKMTKKGIVSRGDSVSSRSSLCSSGSTGSPRERVQSDSSTTTSCSCTSSLNTSYYRIVVFGGPGVGKRSIVNQFLSSDYIDEYDAFPDLSAYNNCVSVLLDGEESTLEFCDYITDKESIGGAHPDAYFVVFSVDNQSSFDVAKDAVGYLRNDLGSDRTIILVANKIDLVRGRQISADDARSVAMEHRCKYIETSATLNHQVDDLLVCVVHQIRLLLNPFLCVNSFEDQISNEKQHSCLKKPIGLLSRLFRKNVADAKLCDNLFEL